MATLRSLVTFVFISFSALPLRAAPVDELIDALRVDDMLVIMRDEGLSYGSEMAADMFAGNSSPRWDMVLQEIYDTNKMGAVVRREFERSIGDGDLSSLIDYFTSSEGQAVVDAELTARRAMVRDAIETGARDRFLALEGTGDARLGQIERFVEANDLVEANVAGALNASFHFYRGLVEGGAFSMSESDILNEVWGQEEDTRQDTREWLYGFLLLAYRKMADPALETYIDLSASEQGRRLNIALFAGFNRMYDEISYALGLAAAREMQGQDL